MNNNLDMYSTLYIMQPINQDNTNSFYVIPNEIILHMYEYLDSKSKSNLVLTCKRMYNISTLSSPKKIVLRLETKSMDEINEAVKILSSLNNDNTLIFMYLPPRFNDLNQFVTKQILAAKYYFISSYSNIEYKDSVLSVESGNMANVVPLDKFASPCIKELRIRTCATSSTAEFSGVTKLSLYASTARIVRSCPNLTSISSAMVKWDYSMPKMADLCKYLKFVEFQGDTFTAGKLYQGCNLHKFTFTAQSYVDPNTYGFDNIKTHMLEAKLTMVDKLNKRINHNTTGHLQSYFSFNEYMFTRIHYGDEPHFSYGINEDYDEINYDFKGLVIINNNYNNVDYEGVEDAVIASDIYSDKISILEREYLKKSPNQHIIDYEVWKEENYLDDSD